MSSNAQVVFVIEEEVFNLNFFQNSVINARNNNGASKLLIDGLSKIFGISNNYLNLHICEIKKVREVVKKTMALRVEIETEGENKGLECIRKKEPSEVSNLNILINEYVRKYSGNFRKLVETGAGTLFDKVPLDAKLHYFSFLAYADLANLVCSEQGDASFNYVLISEKWELRMPKLKEEIDGAKEDEVFYLVNWIAK